MVVVTIGGDSYVCDAGVFSGPRDDLVWLLQADLDKIREEFTEGADPDPDETYWKVVHDRFPEAVMVRRDPQPTSEPGDIN